MYDSFLYQGVPVFVADKNLFLVIFHCPSYTFWSMLNNFSVSFYVLVGIVSQLTIFKYEVLLCLQQDNNKW